MIRVEFSRKEYKVECDGCKTIIESNAPSFIISLGVEPHEGMAENIFCLCEDCGNDLQNDMADEYNRFVDLGLQST